MMDLDLDFLSDDGCSLVEGRELTAKDVQGVPTRNVGSVGRIRDRHHSLALAVAEGRKTDKQIAIEAGYTPQTLVRLRTDPNFVELVEYYRTQNEMARRDAMDRLNDLSLDAMDTIAERLEEDPEGFSNKELRELAALALDRTGHGPSSSQNVNLNIGIADRLQAARERVKTIEGEVINGS